MEKLRAAGEERTVYAGKLFHIVMKPMHAGDKTFEFEHAIRPPGTRLIIVKDGKILIIKEYRTEFEGYDYRLPGGKVFDTFGEYSSAERTDMLRYAESAARKECQEETGLKPKRISHFCTSRAGATVEWDLHYFVVDQFDAGEQLLEAGEHIAVHWFPFAEARKLCIDGGMKEDRSVGILLRFLEHRQKTECVKSGQPR